ncbi:outer membrane beta-barrel protein [Lewinella sp. IMCC34183]|uniref:outer membrane beta-barrel protein n=1 Tax=Lewinella sp. IMCC34183 TaxID=2248762 RepID=UPI00130032EE|nr:outer membrane beta-barrel protein [Lewinella sp. IMCC34183]
MKHIFTLLVLLLFSVSATAQLQRGDRLIFSSPTGSYTFPTPSPAAGASAGYDAGDDFSTVRFAASYGHAVLDRVMVGTALYGDFYLMEGGQSFLSLSPFLRYYFLNREKLRVFGEVGSRLGKAGENFTAFDQLNLSAGLQIPLQSDVFFTPNLSYTAMEGENNLGAGARLEIQLRERDGAEKAIGSLRKGQLMLGAESIGIGRRSNFTSAGLSVGGHYFLSDRLAAGVTLGGNHFTVQNTMTDQFIHSSNLTLGASARYYLNNEAHTLWFVEGGVGRAWQRQKTQGADAFSFGTTSASVGGGAQIFVRERISLEVAPLLKYDFRTEKLGAGLNLGLRFNL